MRQTEGAQKCDQRSLLEWIIFGVLAVSLGVVSAFHEPWLNEAQAWQIARNAGLKDILFSIPHYEGHPALWHLILCIPAKLGWPYEFSIKAISNLVILIAGWLLIFRSPFPRVVRLLLPFHYFFFYQNGVVSRPYGLMALALIWIALSFRERQKHCLSFTLALAFLCTISGYGIVLAGGIAMVWTIEILREKKWNILRLSFWRDRRIYALGALLCFAILIILQIMPAQNAYAFTIEKRHSVFYCLMYGLFAMLPDCTLFNLLGCEEMPAYAAMDPIQLTVACIIGNIMLLVILLFSSAENRMYFFVPFVLFQIFSGMVYLTAHHIGIILFFAVFWLWIAWEDPGKAAFYIKLKKKVSLSEKDREVLGRVGRVTGMLLLVVPVFWTIGASYLEIQYDYYFSKDAAAFIREHSLDQLSFLAQFSSEKEPLNVNALDANCNPVALMPYFDQNFCLNLNRGRDDMAYSLHAVASAEESEEVMRFLKEQVMPEALIGNVDLERIYGDGSLKQEYAPVYELSPHYVSIWKFMHVNTVSIQKQYIYVRRDLLDKYGLSDAFDN